jgi:hypothetical protein
LLDALQQAFAQHVDDGLVDLVTDEDDDGQDRFEVQADDWTLVAEGWPLSAAWIAIDAETDAPEQLRPALEATFSDRDLESLTALDGSLNGDLVTMLNESQDELSMALAAMIHADVGDDEESGE